MGGNSSSAVTKTEFNKQTGVQISSEGYIDCGEGNDELKIYSICEMYEVEVANVEILVGANPNLPLRAEIKTIAEIR